jgi:Protein of unknown function (DUF4231)
VDILEYQKERVEDQLDWYDRKAIFNKNRFRLFQIITIIASAIVPIVNIYPIGDVQTRIISSILGGTIAIVTAITQLEKYQESWILYRTTHELLKKEKFLFKNNAGDYNANLSEDDRNRLFVERIETIVSSETTKYFAMYQSLKTHTGARGSTGSEPEDIASKSITEYDSNVNHIRK